MDFGIRLKNTLNKLSILSELRYIFIKIWTHFKKDLKPAVTIPLHQRYYLTYIYGYIKFYCTKKGVLNPLVPDVH